MDASSNLVIMLSRLTEIIESRFANTLQTIPAKTTLLSEGEVSHNIYYIKKGALRMWFNKDGKDITFQFFFEGMAVSSIDSFFNASPSLFYIEAIEDSQVIAIDKASFEEHLASHPTLKDDLISLLTQRFQNYAQLFLSRIKDTPEERYRELLAKHPEIIQRVAQHYIASYLGITPVSLSRIRNRR